MNKITKVFLGVTLTITPNISLQVGEIGHRVEKVVATTGIHFPKSTNIEWKNIIHSKEDIHTIQRYLESVGELPIIVIYEGPEGYSDDLNLDAQFNEDKSFILTFSGKYSSLTHSKKFETNTPTYVVFLWIEEIICKYNSFLLCPKAV